MMFFILSSTPVLTVSIDVVFIISIITNRMGSDNDLAQIGDKPIFEPIMADIWTSDGLYLHQNQ